MKILKLFTWHNRIGKIIDIFLACILFSGVLGWIILRKSPYPDRDPSKINLWIGDSFLLHNKYLCTINITAFQKISFWRYLPSFPDLIAHKYLEG